ncbi:MAG: PP2C family protein-serine/threonine phosphatase [Pirellulaceae bacterium]
MPNAGHEHPFIQEPEKAVYRLEASDLLLGVDENMTFTEETIPVASGTRIVLVSDGVTEMFDPEENQFGTERVSRVMESSAALDARQLVDDFSEALARFRQSRPPFDDTTLLAAVLTDV